MGALQILVFIATGIALHILPTATGQEQSLGKLPNCAHKLGGEVFVKNEREVIIRNFRYDGRGPAAWFHAMRRGATGGIYNSDDSYYYTLPDNHENCDSVRGHEFTGNEDITLLLPVSIKELETIGMLCYRFCQNFGYVNIPHDLEVPEAPDDLPVTKDCPRPNYTPCTDKGGAKPTKAGGPNCSPVGEGLSGRLPDRSTPSPGSTEGGGTITTVGSGTSEKGDRGRVRFGNLLPGLIFLVIDAALRVDDL